MTHVPYNPDGSPAWAADLPKGTMEKVYRVLLANLAEAVDDLGGHAVYPHYDETVLPDRDTDARVELLTWMVCTIGNQDELIRHLRPRCTNDDGTITVGCMASDHKVGGDVPEPSAGAA